MHRFGAGNDFCALQRLKMISRLTAALFAVCNGLCGAIADAGHAVGAAAAPDGPAVSQGDVVRRAALCASAAAGAGRTDSKGLVFDKA